MLGRPWSGTCYILRAAQVETPPDSTEEEAEEMAARLGQAPASEPSGSRFQIISERI